MHQKWPVILDHLRIAQDLRHALGREANCEIRVLDEQGGDGGVRTYRFRPGEDRHRGIDDVAGLAADLHGRTQALVLDGAALDRVRDGLRLALDLGQSDDVRRAARGDERAFDMGGATGVARASCVEMIRDPRAHAGEDGAGFGPYELLQIRTPFKCGKSSI